VAGRGGLHGGGPPAERQHGAEGIRAEAWRRSGGRGGVQAAAGEGEVGEHGVAAGARTRRWCMGRPRSPSVGELLGRQLWQP
jgi:hypothetical protein